MRSSDNREVSCRLRQPAQGIGFVREIFKNTYAYLDYGKVDNNNAPSTKAYALGVIYVFELPILR